MPKQKSTVSIPFKRERLSKASAQRIRAGHNPGFYSLQTGKQSASGIVVFFVSLIVTLFRFPSNGKPHRKPENTTRAKNRFYYVSIPFKRERTAKTLLSGVSAVSAEGLVSIPFKRETGSQVLDTPIGEDTKYSFQSLQTGTHSASEKRITAEIIPILFPFPSNGNAERKRLDVFIITSEYAGFHSLQTGKRMPSDFGHTV